MATHCHENGGGLDGRAQERSAAAQHAPHATTRQRHPRDDRAGEEPLIAVGGVTTIIPEVHRIVVDVHHWVSDAEFMQLFVIAGPPPAPTCCW
jgi:hypothetical protein